MRLEFEPFGQQGLQHQLDLAVTQNRLVPHILFRRGLDIEPVGIEPFRAAGKLILTDPKRECDECLQRGFLSLESPTGRR